jgi:hypothetical protein
MSFQPPTFISLTSLWRTEGIGGAYGAPDLQFLATLSCGRRVAVESSPVIPTQFLSAHERFLLCPKLTDIRARWNNVLADIVEFPAGSKRFYGVVDVDDVGKGFANEYRLVVLRYNSGGTPTLPPGFAAPVPMP